MNLYDDEISKMLSLIKNAEKLPGTEAWEMTPKETLVLRSDMAYELGGGTNAAVSAIAFTTSQELVPHDGVYLAGNDLTDIKNDIPYARITLVRLKEEYANGSAENVYSSMRAIDYVRYHSYPKGFMMRISSIREREPVRVSKQAIADGISFAGVGSELVKQYRKRPETAAVAIYFVTAPDVAYGELGAHAHRCEQITDSLNHIFNGLVMDCSTCSSKELCDEIDGLRDVHKNIEQNVEKYRT